MGILPLFFNLTHDLPRETVRRIILQSVLTASGVAVIFLIGGPALLKMLGITVADFMVAGGVLLLVISISDILTTQKIQRQVDPESLGAVPLGVPLITGPAVLTTSLLLVAQYGFAPTTAALLANVLITGIVFWFSQSILRFLGKAGAGTLSKIAGLLLAAIAVMLVRKGITSFLNQG